MVEASAEATGAAALPSGTVTLLLTDVEGSTTLWERDEELAAAMIARHYEFLDAAITLHGGKRPVEQGEGDSVVGAFARASDALAAALDVQRALRDEHWPDERGLRIRIALHTGEATLRDEGNYAGPAIIRCARMRAIAHGGQTLLSDATRALVADALPEGATLIDLGPHRLKDLGRPERVWQLCHPELESDFPPLRSLDTILNNLPSQLSSFVGRAAELTELRALLTDNRLVTLVGAGGCGKTRLAVHVAAETVDRHPDGVWWVDLAPVTDPELVPLAVLRAMGLREERLSWSNSPATDTLCRHLADLNMMIAFDNCEHVVEASALLVERLLLAAPGVRVLTTSREPLGVRGEVTYRVPSLAGDEATQLFVERAAQVRPGFAPDAAETEAIAGICRRLDGIALGIELAAARMRMMRPARVLSALNDRFSLLTGGGRTAVPRQQTLELSVAWSHDLLDEDERTVLRRLSVFAGGFTLEAAEAVCADGIVDRYAVLDVLARLVDKSLVQVDVTQGSERYRLLETIRLFTALRLAESGEGAEARDRHLGFLVHLAEEAEPTFASADPVWLSRIEDEHDNIVAALEWAEETAARESLLRLVTALTLFFEMRQHLGDADRWFTRALAGDKVPSSLTARALWGAAHIAMYRYDPVQASLLASEALEMARNVGDKGAEARALNTLGYAQSLPDPEGARRTLAESIELGRTIGDDWVVVDGLKMMTVAWALQGDYDGLIPARDEMLRVAEGLDNKFFIAWYHCLLGRAAVSRGEVVDARRSLETSLTYCRAVGEPATAAVADALLGEVESLAGNYEAARQRLETNLERAVVTGGSLSTPYVATALIALVIGVGQWRSMEEDQSAEGHEVEISARLTPSLAAEQLDAQAAAERFVDGCRLSGNAHWLGFALALLGSLHLASNDLESAEVALRESADVATRISNRLVLPLARYHFGRLHRARGDESAAEDAHHEALALRAERRLSLGVCQSLEALAGLAAAQESFVEAARLFGAAESLRSSIGCVRFPADQESYDADLALVNDALDGAAYAKAWDEGTAMSVDDAVAYAARGRGERKRPSRGWASLTPAELDVVRHVAHGLTTPQIAEQLFVSRNTVKAHLSHVFAKLGLSTRSELAAEATRHGV